MMAVHQDPPASGISTDGLQLEPIASAVPDSLANFNIAAIEPLLPLLDPKVVDPKLLAEVATLVPLVRRGAGLDAVRCARSALRWRQKRKRSTVGLFSSPCSIKNGPQTPARPQTQTQKQINVTWVKELLPYLNGTDPHVVGKLFRDLLPMLQGVSRGAGGALCIHYVPPWGLLGPLQDTRKSAGLQPLH
jgi:hypothetical protein